MIQSTTQSRLRAALVAFSLIGVVLCGVLLGMSPSLRSAGPRLGAALCAPSERINCDHVLASRWAKIGPLPAAAVGLTYFLLLAAWFLIVGVPNRVGRRWHYVPMTTTAAGVTISCFYVYVMFIALPVWCTWCLAVHGVNGVLFVLAVASWPRSTADGLLAYPSPARGWAAVGVCAAGAMIAYLAFFGLMAQTAARRFQLDYLAATNNASYVQWRWAQSAVQDIPIRSDDLSIGPAQAPNTLVVFQDFECPSCAGLHRYVQRLGNLFPGRVHCVFKHYPMAAACNRYVKQEFHFFACEAATAAEAARRVGSCEQALEYQAKLFEGNSRLDQRPYTRLAGELKLDLSMFEYEQLTGEEGRRRIEEDVELAHRLGVEGTPAIFLNGRRLTAWHLTTSDARPVIDLAATDAMWKALLDAPGKPAGERP